MNNHEIIMASPPWDKFKAHKKHLHHLNQPSGEALIAADMFAMFELGLLQLPSANHCAFIWVAQRFLQDCYKYMVARGYKKHNSYVWVRAKERGDLVTFPCMYLEWYYKGGFLPISDSAAGSKAVLVDSAKNKYSKPDCAYQMIEALYPGHDKVELFGWERRPGWQQWANYKDRIS